MNEYDALRSVQAEIAKMHPRDQISVQLAAQRIRRLTRSAAGKLAVQLVHLEILNAIPLPKEDT